MLGKLLKYEFKATSRMLLPMYAVLLLFGLINRFLNPFNSIKDSANFNLHSVLSIFGIVLYFALIVGVLVMTFIIMIQRFYKNLLCDEGYLMFTLPVKSWQHIVSKLLVSMLWMILSFLIVLCSILILSSTSDLLNEISNAFNSMKNLFGNVGLILIPIYSLITIAYYIVTIYDSMALGHLFTKHRILASFGAYIILYIISQIVFSIFLLIFAAANPGLFISGGIPTQSQIITILTSACGICLLLGAGNFILTNIILKRKLNLE